MSDLKNLYPFIMNHNETAENPSTESKFYINMLEAYDGFPRFASWNWSAFLFGAGWFLYRKMYLYAAMAFLLEMLLFLLETLTLFSNELGLSFAIFCLYGVFGNAIYRHDLEKRKANNSKTKGTSTLLAALYAVFIAAIFVISFILELKKTGVL